MSEATVAVPARRWRPPPFIANPRLRVALYGGALFYLALALATLEINWARAWAGLDRGWQFVWAFLQPDFTARWQDVLQGMQESLTMTVTATVAGIALSLPFGLGAARNLAPRWVYYACRSVIAVSRSLHEVVVAILFVALVGFGPFAGFLTITFATIGFLGKLLAEDIEDSDPGQLEAIRATGAGWWQQVNYAVQPQVTPRLVGLCLYRLDINFRDSAIVGIVGAGGIGATLNTAIDRYEFDVAAGILIIIIAIVFMVELSSSWIRNKVQ
ncbi:MAG: phosphonate ABC transporter, permease protein PhnE [Burkholderiaceae bacterium]|nr:phosphonate ABC transporter, permease protein PhnE [Burkholderiaceae bacterium]